MNANLHFFCFFWFYSGTVRGIAGARRRGLDIVVGVILLDWLFKNTFLVLTMKKLKRNSIFVFIEASLLPFFIKYLRKIWIDSKIST